jgi:hypothetical protein
VRTLKGWIERSAGRQALRELDALALETGF